MSEIHEHPAAITIQREGGFRFRVRFDRVPGQIVTDELPPIGAGAGPGPSALLGAAVGNCLASSLLFCLEKSHVEVRDLEAEVEVETARNPEGRMRIPAIRVRLGPTLADAAAAQRIGRCLELYESFCVVTESVRQGIDVSVEVEPRAAEIGPGPRDAAPAAAPQRAV